MSQIEIQTNMRLAIERKDNVVILTMTCNDAYAAIGVHDSMISDLRETGELTLSLFGAKHVASEG